MEMLSGKRIVLVGGTSGMGAAAARVAQAEGAEVVIASRSGEKVAAMVASLGGAEAGVNGVTLDVRSTESIEAGLATIGPYDHIFITASPGGRSKFEGPVEDAMDYFEGKFWSSYRIARESVAHLRPGGSILFVTGTMSQRPHGAAAVTAAFSAVEGLTRALAIELAPLRVNCLRPGFVATEFWNFMPDGQREKMIEERTAEIPVGKAGTGEDIGRAAVAFMANEYISGQILTIDGAALLK